jgi:RimJ/RimL family protein N-acetyltransferase
MSQLRQHQVCLVDSDLRLRPMGEQDWDLLLRWNNDPEVLYFVEDDDITSWSLEDMQEMYRGVSQQAYVFVIEVEGRPVGECWLQEMNLQHIAERFAGEDVRRIDLMIGEKEMWGHGYGTRTIGLLVRFAFEQEGADLIYEPGIGGHNPRSRRAFERNGFTLDHARPLPPGAKADQAFELVLTRKACDRLSQGSPACKT